MIGQTISHYKILEKLGEGGMGVVYKAEDTKLDRILALKFLPQRMTSAETERARFLQEAKAASAINHPNVCVVHDIQEYQGQQYIVMEYVEGVTLRENLREKTLETKVAIDYAIQVAEALGAAHDKGIIHRDVKSDNIMVTPSNKIKVMDFGLAKLRGSLKLTKTSSTLGTLAYMSPEHIQGGEVDLRSDIFSFGVVLYEMLTGHLPFQGEYESALMYAILNDEPEPIQPYRPDLPSEFLHVLNRTLEKDANDRYQSVGDMLIDLRRLKRDSDRVSRSSPEEVSDTAKSQAARKSGGIGGERKRSPYKRLLWTMIGLFGVSAIVLVLFMILREEKTTTQYQGIDITRLTTSGKTKDAAISPDGNYVAHVKKEAGKESLWLMQIATNSNIQILEPADAGYAGLTFSPDGNYVYFVRFDRKELFRTLYRVPVLGGPAIEVLDDVESPVTFSPDGERFAFVRTNMNEGESVLIVANKDGSGEEKLAVRKSPSFLSSEGCAWSPDGSVIICGVVRLDAGSEEPCGLVAVALEDGSIMNITSKRWGRIDQIAWLSDGSGVLMSAADRSSGYFFQVWFVSYPGGEARRITHDLNNYLRTSLTNDSNTLLTINSDWLSDIWIAPTAGLDRASQITSGKYDGLLGIAWTPQGKIVYASRSFDIWMMEADGRNQRLLTLNEHTNWGPTVSPDGRHILFGSWREGSVGLNIWRMDIDGGNIERLTDGWEDGDPQFSPDGKWIVYVAFVQNKDILRRIPVEGGDAVQLTDKWSSRPAVSPDGSWIACFYKNDPAPQSASSIAIIPWEGGEPTKTFDVPHDGISRAGLRWRPDGSALTYVVHRGGASNIWSQPLDGSPPVQLTRFESKRIFAFDWSKDGRYLACSRGEYDDDAVLIRNFR